MNLLRSIKMFERQLLAFLISLVELQLLTFTNKEEEMEKKRQRGRGEKRINKGAIAKE